MVKKVVVHTRVVAPLLDIVVVAVWMDFEFVMDVVTDIHGELCGYVVSGAYCYVKAVAELFGDVGAQLGADIVTDGTILLLVLKVLVLRFFMKL